ADDNAHGLADRQAAYLRKGSRPPLVGAVGGDLGVVIEDLGGEAQLLTAVRQRLALLPGQCHGYRLEAVAEQLGSCMEDARALGDRRFRPGWKGRGGRAQRAV